MPLAWRQAVRSCRRLLLSFALGLALSAWVVDASGVVVAAEAPVTDRALAQAGNTAAPAMEDLFGLIQPGEDLWLGEADLRVLLGTWLPSWGPMGEMLLGELTGLKAHFESREAAHVTLYFKKPLTLDHRGSGEAKRFQWVATRVPRTLRFRLELRPDRIAVRSAGADATALGLQVKVLGGVFGVTPLWFQVNPKTSQVQVMAAALGGRVPLYAEGRIGKSSRLDWDLWRTLREGASGLILPTLVFRSR